MFDVNTAIGHWPFRQIPNQSIGALRAHLGAHGIAGAAVAHTHGLFYKNCHDANLELAEAIEPHRGFFAGIATLNPTYAAWERDLAACIDDLGLKALRLAPQYHDYTLADPCAVAMAKAAACSGIPLFIPHRVVDTRQRHWMDTDCTTSLADVMALARAVPEGRFVFTEYAASAPALVGADGEPICPNLSVETSRMVSSYGQVLAAVVHAIGPERVLFGTGAPFKGPTPALLKLHHADLTEEEREMVGGGSARILLGCSGSGAAQGD